MYHDVIKDWIRVEILEVQDEMDKALILLVDFGTQEEVDITREGHRFRCLPEKAVTIPSQAVTVQLPLAGVSDGDKDVDEDILLSLMSECIMSSSDQANGELFIRCKRNNLLFNKSTLYYLLKNSLCF